MQTMRPWSCLLALALAAAPVRPAHACLLVQQNLSPKVTGLRASVTLGSGRVDVILQLTFSDVAMGSLGIVLPLPAKPTVVSSTQPAFGDVAFLGDLDAITAPQVLTPATASCNGGSTTSPAPRPPQRGGGFGDVITHGDDTYTTVTDAAGLDDWVAAQQYTLPKGARSRLLGHLAAGGVLLAITTQSEGTLGATDAYHFSFKGDAVLPVAEAARCATDPLDATFFVIADDPATVKGWPVERLSAIPTSAFAGGAEPQAVYRAEAGEQGGRIVITGFIEPTSQIAAADVPASTELGILQSFSDLTRLDAVAAPAAATTSPTIVRDPGAPEQLPAVDLRPNPTAHGASILGGLDPLLALAVLGLFLLARHRRAGGR